MGHDDRELKGVGESYLAAGGESLECAGTGGCRLGGPPSS